MPHPAILSIALFHHSHKDTNRRLLKKFNPIASLVPDLK